jgi:hypothetical protein
VENFLRDLDFESIDAQTHVDLCLEEPGEKELGDSQQTEQQKDLKLFQELQQSEVYKRIKHTIRFKSQRDR